MTIKTKRLKRRKNPVLESEVNKILDKLNPEYVFYLAEGDYSEVYEFKINENKELDGVVLKKGIYAIKFLRQNNYLDLKDITYLKKLSKLKVIPKIYVISKKYIIMDFIKGDTLKQRLYKMEHPGKKERLIMTLEKMIQNLHDKGIAHGDLHFGNVMIDQEDNMYLIDPNTDSKDFESDENRLYFQRQVHLDGL